MIPLWVQRMPSIWIAAIAGTDPRMPTGAVVVTLPEARAIAAGTVLPIAVARAWVCGADVEHPEDASAEVCTLAHRLRLLLPEATRPFTAKIAADFGLPRLGAVVAASPDVPPLSDLADAVSDTHPDGVPRLSREARLLRALAGI
ncbi:MAG: hypothetical protein ACE37F_27640 [Nannocystaceae bacterium]|nr:hypothetical protein [bacterium]